MKRIFFLIPITKKFYPSTLKKTHLQNQDIILTNMTQWFHEISPEVPRLLKTKSIITSCSTYVGSSSTLFLLILELIRIIRCSIGLIAQHCKEFDKNHRIRQRCRKCFTNFFVLFFREITIDTQWIAVIQCWQQKFQAIDLILYIVGGITPADFKKACLIVLFFLKIFFPSDVLMFFNRVVYV